MPVVLVQQGPAFTQERYEEIVRRLTGKSRMETPADWPVEGCWCMSPDTAKTASG